MNFSHLSIELFSFLFTIVVTLIGAWVMIKDRITKLEVQNESDKELVEAKLNAINIQILHIQTEQAEGRIAYKEMMKTMNENTTAIRELSIILENLKEKIHVARTIRTEK